ncbi:hypothetical protein [Nocardia miyunensis]|uniref:hypothetical protein n=1 Tax=Nocardia miyunensis TaxID=282684 RepID=UPI000830DA59|nr:hypothetical protein [Nocardia miyunensis]
MKIEQIRDLAQQAAYLLPAAPMDNDALNWLSWRELVWDTAHRLSEIGGTALAQAGYAPSHDVDRGVVSAEDLLGLATQLYADIGPAGACELSRDHR